jgi:hypothetical protein
MDPERAGGAIEKRKKPVSAAQCHRQGTYILRTLNMIQCGLKFKLILLHYRRKKDYKKLCPNAAGC